MPSVVGECTPLQSGKKQRPSFLTHGWVLTILALCLSVSIAGCLLHWQHARTQGRYREMVDKQKVTAVASKVAKAAAHAPHAPQQHPHKLLRKTVQPKLRKSGKPPAPPPFKPADAFKQCNPYALREKVGGGALPVVFDRTFCKLDQAALIYNLFGKERYSFDAVVPEPYIYPAHVLETLVAMDPGELEATLTRFWSSTAEQGKLGTFVKLFAWGIPVPRVELMKALGDDSALSALEDCGVVVQCEAMPDVVSSAVQVFPVQHTPILVATDWSLPYVSSAENTAEPVKPPDAHDIFVIQNFPRFPHPAGKTEDGVHVLNLGSESGVLGLAAADKGSSAVLVDPNPRAASFGRFNSQLNQLQGRVTVYERDLADVFKMFHQHDFFLILAHPVSLNPKTVEDTIHFALEATKAMLPADSGMSIISFENENCEDFTRKYNNNFCGEEVLGQTFEEGQGTHNDLAGSVICRHPNDDGSNSVAKEGMVFAYRGIPEVERERVMSLDSCGHFDTVRMPSFIGSDGVRACKFARPDLECDES